MDPVIQVPFSRSPALHWVAEGSQGGFTMTFLRGSSHLSTHRLHKVQQTAGFGSAGDAKCSSGRSFASGSTVEDRDDLYAACHTGGGGFESRRSCSLHIAMLLSAASAESCDLPATISFSGWPVPFAVGSSHDSPTVGRRVRAGLARP